MDKPDFESRVLHKKIDVLVVSTNIHDPTKCDPAERYFVVKRKCSRVVYNLKGQQGAYVRIDNRWLMLYSEKGLVRALAKAQAGKLQFKDERPPGERLNPAENIKQPRMPYCVLQESPGRTRLPIALGGRIRYI